VIWIPKYRKKTLYGQLRKYLGQVFKDLARHRESEVLEGHMMPDHVHMLLSIPPKYSVAQVVGYIKGKSAIHVARNYLGKRKSFTGAHFWARGYHVSTVGRDERVIRDYIRHQEQEDRRIDQLQLFK
jgi:putative transposase